MAAANAKSSSSSSSSSSPIEEDFSYEDSFLDTDHILESFPTAEVVIDPEAVSPYRLRITRGTSKDKIAVSSSVSAVDSWPFAAFTQSSNSVRFTPAQIEAVRSGMNKVRQDAISRSCLCDCCFLKKSNESGYDKKQLSLSYTMLVITVTKLSCNSFSLVFRNLLQQCLSNALLLSLSVPSISVCSLFS